MESKVYNQEGKEKGKISLPEAVFGVRWNADMVHQVVTSILMSRRNSVAHAKNRGEVSGGGKKPWRQKGTGRARHGSIRSPLWVGGGVTHGPRKDKNFARKVNRTETAKALAAVLSKKLKDGEIILIDEIKLAEAKTKTASAVLKAVSGVKGFEALPRKTVWLALSKNDAALKRSFRNIANLDVIEARNLNAADALAKKYIALVEPAETIKILTSRVK